METPHPLVKFLPDATYKRIRPALERRTERVVMLVSRPEKGCLLSMARERGCEISTILRAAIDAVPPTRMDGEVLSELHKVGANLSLLLRQMVYGAPEQAEVIVLLVQIQEIYQRILEDLEP